MKKALLIVTVSLLLTSCNDGFFITNKRYKLGDSVTLSELIKSQPGDINGYLYDSHLSIHFNEADIPYFNISDSSTGSITYGYGFDEEGIGSTFYLETPGGGFNTLMKAKTCDSGSTSNVDISSTDGVLFYVDLKGIQAEVGHYLGVGLGLILMDSSKEPPSSEYLWEASKYGGHFNYYYPLEGRSAYYYDLYEGKFLPTTIIEKNVVIKEGYSGWIYIPYSSYSWNASTENKYLMLNDAFVNGYKWLNYSHFLTKNIKADETQAKVHFDEFNFVKLSTPNNANFVYQKDLSPTCFDVGGKIYKDEISSNYKLENVQDFEVHHYEYLKYKEGAIGICSKCGDLIYIDDTTGAATGDVSNYIDLHFHYGINNSEEEIVIVRKGDVLSKNKEPKINRIKNIDGWEYDFSTWSASKDSYSPIDPKKTHHNFTKDYYAKYLISSYDNTKYSHVPNLLAMHGGRYGSTKGKIVMNGNSNFALAYQTTNDFAQRGLPTINNAVAGGSTYDYYWYTDQLVMGFAPKILVFNLTTNDQAYWSMSEKDIITTTKKYIDKVHKALPDCQIAIVSASPLPGRSEMFATVERINAQGNKLASELDYAYFIDTYDFVYERMKEYPEGWEFWTHMETETLSTWMNLIADGIQKIIDEKGIIF